MSELTTLSVACWTPLREPWCIAQLDRTVGEISETYGWSWDQADADGLGLMHYLFLAWNGVPRFLLSASAAYPDDGIAVEVEASEDAATARRDLLKGLALTPDAWLTISEGETWFARWDPPHRAGARPATAKPR